MNDLTTVSMTDAAYQAIRRQILAGDIAAGEKINMIKLAREIDVSQGAVREALSRLGAEGMVRLEPNRGYRAAPISVNELTEITQARLVIDAECLRLAIRNGSYEWEGAVLAACHRAERYLTGYDGTPQTGQPFAEARLAFYETLLAPCGNAWLLHMHRLLYTQLSRYRHLCLSFASGKRKLYERNGPFIQAILDRDEEAAIAMLRQHSEEVTRQMKAELDGILPSTPVDAPSPRLRVAKS